jgi:SAM-dependent methyltransferase
MDDRDSLREFWTQPAPEGNVPSDYIGHTARSELLLELIDDLPAEARIVEVGCNVGRNLAWLHDHGRTRLTGVEINPHAVALLRETYPQLADVQVHVGPAEEVLPTLPDDSADLVFTMAVLEHVHPDSTVIFDRMTAIAPRVLAIEPPGTASHRQFAHDVVDVFTSRGMDLVAEQPLVDRPETDLQTYVAWTFERRDRP